MFEVCVNSLYLMFFIVILLKDCLMFLAIKYSNGKMKDMFGLMLILDLVVFFTIPLLILITRGMC